MRVRYLNLDGTIPHLKPGFLSKVFNKDAVAPALTISACALANGMATHDVRMGVLALLCGLSGGAFANYLIRNTIHERLTNIFGSLDDKCFDRKPGANTPPTTPENMRRAHTVSATEQARYSRMMMSGMFMMTAPLFASVTPDFAALNATILTAMSVMGAGLTFSFRNLANNFTNVTSGKWVIRDMPPPQKVKSTAKAPLFGSQAQPF